MGSGLVEPRELSGARARVFAGSNFEKSTNNIRRMSLRSGPDNLTELDPIQIKPSISAESTKKARTADQKLKDTYHGTIPCALLANVVVDILYCSS